ncbi:MAG TPA: thioredoxin family protein [Mycobacteriales bacterium]|jgi:thiol-disulfide isomerase/thioredoxin|nr:thioredoxin family protein [Mycobacteriales bacterium]
MTPLLVLLGTLAAATAAGLIHRRRSGQVRTVDDQRLDADELRRLGGEPGERATLVQFSSAFCAPCRATRRVLGEVAAMVPGVAYVEVDAEQHLDAVRRHAILRTPTTLVLDAAGRVVVRASGQPRKADVIAALGRAVDESTTTKRIT